VRRMGLPGFPEYVVLVARVELPVVAQLLTKNGARSASAETYEILRVETGLPIFGIDMDEERFVVELGRKDAISYNKGC
ncbi:hypothetical protein ABTN36_18925, partial [Acinetobacter baumannii]